jgi:E3 ubiquitin-protein ligase UBR1
MRRTMAQTAPIPSSAMTTQERQLCEYLRDLPMRHKNRYGDPASKALLSNLFWSLAGGQESYMRLFFPEGVPKTTGSLWRLKQAQGAVDGAEYTEAARGKACGHIFKSGEATYRCKTCSIDETCVLCSRCYDSSDHTGHMVYISISPGNSGCCDCGDAEAWRIPVHCTIHSEHNEQSNKRGKAREAAALPEELVESIRMTVGRAFDYICDVISCSPEHLRGPKSADSIRLDERMSRLTSNYYRGDIIEEPTEYALLLWNDEKHTVNEVRDQVARACKLRTPEALAKAHETDDIGRTIVKYDTDVDRLLEVSKIIEQIKVTVTIRSARDTFREQMCGTIIEWLGDIAGCSVGEDHNILRHVVCEEMLKSWRAGSEASNATIGKNGIDDQELDDRIVGRESLFIRQAAMLRAQRRARAESDDDSGTDDDDDDDAEDGDREDVGGEDDVYSDVDVADVIIDVLMGGTQIEVELDTDADVDMTEDDTALEVQEATLAGYPPPPPPPPPPAPVRVPQAITRLEREVTPSDSDTAEPLIPPSVYAKVKIDIPKTPGVSRLVARDQQRPPRYWLETPEAFRETESLPLHEDLFQRVRLDWMILFDLRMWKKVRVDLRDLYISTVVTIPQFKRILGLRFAGLYTLLAQLYLIADREPDHSIINISLQMLTTPSITSEIVERGNFLTNLMAILYTFLTTRQVDHPYEIQPNETLNFEAGSVTNRRMYHFFMDLRYLFGNEHVQERLRMDDRYMMQFLDLVKLHQGICPNTRAVGEHVEYETDAWISASLITREINRLCRQFSESFKWKEGDEITAISRAIRLAAKTVILNSLGTERKRFKAAEIKEEVKFKKVADYEFDTTDSGDHSVVEFVVDTQPISFHHALHYTLSWLIECGKSMSPEQLKELLTFTTEDLIQKPKAMGFRVMPNHGYSPEDHLIAAFDYPLRVCAWLAQMKASMWVRNGMSLRHQAGTYRGVTQRDVSHHRDIFLLQTAMILCPPSRVLASMLDRYGMEHWVKGIYERKKPDIVDDAQQLDIAEDMIHLLIVLLSDRTSLISIENEPNPHGLAMRRDITHVLCFKPLSFSEICSKLPDKFQEQEECQDILDEMTTFKPPEGLSDVGTFELKEQFMEDLDPYIAHYNKNQREESENAYRAWMAKKTGKLAADVVFEPKLRPIDSGVFMNLAAFTRTGIFAQIVYYSLLYPLKAQEYTPNVPATRVEAFLQVVLHLVLIAIAEDKTEEDEMSEESLDSFVYISLTRNARSNFMADVPQAKTIVSLLEMMSAKESFKACHPKIALVLKRMRQKRPRNFETAFSRLGVSVDRVATASPANSTADEDREKKKKQALARQAKVMAQFQQQQRNFIDNQGDIDWGEEEVSDEDMTAEAEEHKDYWKYPSGTCILCQEETNDTRPYGTFAMLTKSRILRQTDLSDPDFVREVAKTVVDLDRSADMLRPCGVSGDNREQIHKISADGKEIVTERQVIGKGYPSAKILSGPVSVGCGHIMHYKCFEQYYEASNRRHSHQIARHHPERLDLMEFVCPLCKAQGNAFLPIIWKGKEETFPGVLQPNETFESFLVSEVASTLKRAQKSAEPDSAGSIGDVQYQILFDRYNQHNIVQPLASKLQQLQSEAWNASASTPTTSGASSLIRSLAPNTAGGVPGAFPSDIPEMIGFTSQLFESVDPAMIELVAVYRRLAKTMERNKLESFYKYDRDQQEQIDLFATDTLAQSLGFSISAVEIQQRGVESELGATLLQKTPMQSLTHLRILAETAASYVTLGGLRYMGKNRAAAEYSQSTDRQVFQLYFGHPQIFPLSLETKTQNHPPVLSLDSFVFLTECSLAMVPVLGVDIMNVVRLCYMVEIVKVVMAMARNMPSQKWMTWLGIGLNSQDNGSHPDFRRFCGIVTQLDIQNLQQRSVTPNIEGANIGFDQPWMSDIGACRSFVQKYALVFLRKCVLLLFTRYGTDFNSHISPNPEASELDRLTEALRLPSLDEMCASVANSNSQDESTNALQQMVCGWIQHSVEWLNGGKYINHAMNISISHPVIFELIGLPKNYDTLMEETMRRRCPTTGKDVSDPMICLFCSDIFCGQSICCLKEEGGSRGRPATQIGGAQQHMRK